MARLRAKAKAKAPIAKKAATAKEPVGRGGRRAAARRAPATPAQNPLLAPWATPFEMPPFDRIGPSISARLQPRLRPQHHKEIEAIAGDRAKPTFENTIEALERAGRGCSIGSRACSTIWPAPIPTRRSRPSSARSRRASPSTTRASTRTPSCSSASMPLMQRQGRPGPHARSRRACWSATTAASCAPAPALGAKARERMAAIAERLATLGTRFNQNVLADEQAYLLVLEPRTSWRACRRRCAPLRRRRPPSAATRASTPSRLARSSIEPFLQFSARRDLREQAYKAWRQRGANGGKTDNRKIIAEILALRAERAAHARLRDLRRGRAGGRHGQDAGGRAQAADGRSGSPPRPRAAEERADLDKAVLGARAAISTSPAGTGATTPRRCARPSYDVDEAEVKPYLQLDNVHRGGLRLRRQAVRRELQGAQRPARLPPRGALLGGGGQGRAARRACSWATTSRGPRSARAPGCRAGARQHKLDAQEVRPIIVNVMNFAKGAPGEPALL